MFCLERILIEKSPRFFVKNAFSGFLDKSGKHFLASNDRKRAKAAATENYWHGVSRETQQNAETVKCENKLWSDLKNARREPFRVKKSANRTC